MHSQFISIFLSVINLLQKIGFTVKLSSFISRGANILGRPTQKLTGKPSLIPGIIAITNVLRATSVSQTWTTRVCIVFGHFDVSKQSCSISLATTSSAQSSKQLCSNKLRLFLKSNSKLLHKALLPLLGSFLVLFSFPIGAP